MKQQVSIVYSTQKFPFAKYCQPSDMDEAIGEKYFKNHNIIVLENCAREMKITLAKEKLYCIDELTKVLPKEKKITAILLEREEILRFITGSFDVYDMNNCR